LAAPAFSCAEHGAYRGPRPPKRTGCTGCWSAYGQWRAYRDLKTAVRSKGRAKGGGQSSKAKGRSACLAVQAALLAAAPQLTEGDVFVKATSQLGVDLHLSPLARAWFQFSIEAKNVESLNIWKALKQATDNASPDLPPIVFFKRAHSDMFVALRAVDFLRLIPWPVTDEPKRSSS
jgi:hypothetical protein